MIVHCGKCSHEWEVLLPLPIAIPRAARIMRGIVAAGCPGCGKYGAGVVFFGTVTEGERASKASSSKRRRSKR